jgi:AcrR family transcriptional regulator
MAAAQPEPRLPLSRDRILAAALALVDEGGIEALSMRRLGQALGFEAMSLYNHVANKDDVIDGILDLVLAETEPPSQADDWAAAVRASAVSVHDALRRHPWSCALLMSPGRIRPARLSYMDALLGRLREAGFTAEATYHAYHALDGHIFGFSLWQLGHSVDAPQIADMAAAVERLVPADRYPYLHEHARQHLSDGPHQQVPAFEFALDLIIDGLRKLRAGTADEAPPTRAARPPRGRRSR